MGLVDDLRRRLSTPGAEAYSRDRFQASRPDYLQNRPEDGSARNVVPPALYDFRAAERRRRRRVFLGLGLLAAVAAVAAGTFGGIRWYREMRTVQKHHVRLSVSGPDHVTSGEDLTVRVQLENASRVGWERVAVSLQVPEGFAPKASSPSPVGPPLRSGGEPLATATKLVWDLGTVPARAAQDIVLSGRLVGEEGTTALFTTSVTLTPSNRPQVTVEKTAFSSVALAAIPIDVSLDVPRAAASGTPLTVRVAYQNRTAKDVVGARLKLEPPAGFSVSAATPPLKGRDLVWDLPTVPPQGQGEVSVAGVIEGDPESVKAFTARLGFVLPDGKFLAQRSVQRSLALERAALSITQVLNEEKDLLKVAPGAEITGAVQYKNTGTGGLREVIVRLVFEGVGLDESSVKVTGGFFDSRGKQMTWTAASTPQLRALRPGESGALPFSFRLLPVAALPLSGSLSQNFSLLLRAVGDSPDLPTPPGAPKQVASDRFEILLNSVPAVTLGAFYDDGRAGLPVSTGPLPPQVGQETTFTVRARLSNTSNDLIDAAYRTTLPENVQWTSKEYHTVGDVRFNERTREVLWTVPLLPSRAGVALPEPEFAFQVSIRPSLNEVGAAVALTKGHVLEGTDAYTTVRLRAEAPAVTTESVDPKKAQVIR